MTPRLALVVALSLVACRARDDKPAEIAACSPPAPPPLPPDIGTRHPAVVAVLGPQSSWAVLCQARSGKRLFIDVDGPSGGPLEPYLFQRDARTNQWTPPTGQPIDAFVDYSPDGRRLIILRDGAVRMLDTQTGTEQVLEHAATETLHGWAGNGARFTEHAIAYLADRASHTLVALDLRSAKKVSVRTQRQISDMHWEHGPWLALWLYRDPGPPYMVNGIERIPIRYHESPISSPVEFACSGGMFGDHEPHDRDADAWFNTETGEYVEDRTVLAHLDRQVLRQARSGEITLDAVEIVPRDCAATPFVIASSPLRIIAMCKRAKAHTLELFGPGVHVVLDPTVRTELHRFRRGRYPVSYSVIRRVTNERYACVPSIMPNIALSETACFELATGQRIPSQGIPRGIFTSATGDYLVSGSGDQQVATHLQTGVISHLFPMLPITERPASLQLGERHRARIDEYLIDFDISPPRAIAYLGERPLDIDDQGRFLVEADARPPDNDYPWGPLRWIDP